MPSSNDIILCVSEVCLSKNAENQQTHVLFCTLVSRIIVSKLLLILGYLVLRNSLILSETIINFPPFGIVKLLFQVKRLLKIRYFAL